ncbi:tyrosine-protein phosphatase [Lactobacillus sp. ESL0677]|uniref:tyrosine-protein phosphatase n=1 Tax=Lactobacillus sp. ESL0677 TaxID=2983208 RepID=UPI0023F7AE8F|nr:tyrosine-protein phosphatase [Lactobacillus sp. ESL0677]WEV37653.1 tyrosine-protein phosphatase [Lactobacillus sp. ESL0677]
MNNKKYTVVQKQKGHFHFKNLTATSKEQVTVFLLETPDDNNPKILGTQNGPEFEIKLDLENKRPYFRVDTINQSYIIAERTLPVDGMNNFRDLGGYLTNDGRSVKWGRLYRSDQIYNATSEGLEYLRQLNIGTIIDYRSNSEVRKYPNKSITSQVKTYQLDPSSDAAELSAQMQSSKENEDINLINEIIQQRKKGTLTDHSKVVVDEYRAFVTNPKAQQSYGTMLKVIANSTYAAIDQHCRGGKDRTGYGVMLVLGVLGVDTEDILEDYLITGQNRQERNRIKMVGYRKLTSDPFVLDYLYSFIDTQSKFLEASINEILTKYDSIADYALNELHISRDEIQKMRDTYLE